MPDQTWTRADIGEGVVQLDNGEVSVRIDGKNLVCLVEGNDGFATEIPARLLVQAGRMVAEICVEKFGGEP